MVSALLWFACAPIDRLGALVPPTVDEDPSLPHITVTVAGVDRRLHASSWGDPEAPLLLALHGSLGDHRALQDWSAWSDRYHVVAWDQRGNGLSERISAEEYTVESIVAEIDAVRAHYGAPDTITLVGHSFGAMYASLYVQQRPEAVHELVLIEPGGLTGEIFGDTFRDIITVELWAPGINRAFWQSETLSASDHAAVDYKSLRILLDGSATAYHCDPNHPVPIPVWRPGGHVEYLRGELLRGGGPVGTFTYDFLPDPAVAETIPTLFVAGDCSGLGPTFQERHHLPSFPGADLLSVPAAGHRVWTDAPETVEAIGAWLDPTRRGAR